MRSHDLVPLIAPVTKKGGGVSARSGLIVTWDQETAANTVLVGNSLMENLTILNTSEAAILTAGDVVTILTFGYTWGIMGRYTIPGTPEAVSALSSLRTQSASEDSIDSFTSTSFTAAPSNPGPEVEIAVGPTGRLLILLSAEISGQSDDTAGSTAICGGAMGFALSGANTLAASRARAVVASNNETVTSSDNTVGVTDAATRTVLLDGLNPGLTTVTSMYALVGDGTQVNINNRNITAIAI